MPTIYTILVAKANLLPSTLSLADSGASNRFSKSRAKKFQDVWPSTLSMATKLAEGKPDLKNLSAIPGVNLLKAP